MPGLFTPTTVTLYFERTPDSFQTDAADELRRVHLGEDEVVVKADEVEHPSAHEVRHALAGLALGIDDVVGADAGEDLAVRLRDGLGPDLRHLQVDEVGRDQHRCLDRGTPPRRRRPEVLCADLPEGIDVLRIGLHGVRDALGPLLHELEVVVDREHLAVEAVELSGAGGAEPAEADDEDGASPRGLQPTIGLSTGSE